MAIEMQANTPADSHAGPWHSALLSPTQAFGVESPPLIRDATLLPYLTVLEGRIPSPAVRDLGVDPDRFGT